MEKIAIKSKVGDVLINPDTIITFPKGILGFPNHKHYVLLDPENQTPLKILQSTDDPGLAFIVANPMDVKPDYEIELFDNDMEEIKLTEDNVSALVYLVIITIPTEVARMTANLKGPLIINSESRLAKQLVLDSKKYDLKYHLMPQYRDLNEEEPEDED